MSAVDLYDHAPQRNGSFDRESHDGCDVCALARCVLCGGALTDSLIRLGSTSCLDCPPTASYPMRFTHP